MRSDTLLILGIMAVLVACILDGPGLAVGLTGVILTLFALLGKGE